MRFLLTISFLLTVTTALSQTVVKGIVKDAKGESIPGVNVYFKGTYLGTSSELDGSYSLANEENGMRTLIFQAIGFKTVEREVLLNGEPTIINPIMKEAINEMTAVTITAGAMEASDEKRAVVLRPMDIVTVPSAMGDIIGAFQTLPGTATVGNDGRLFVRGGDASETAIFIDGMKVGNAFGTTAANVPTRTRFNPNLFKGSFFSTGGYSAEFGHALSSALALNTVDFPLRNQGDISIMSVGGGYTQTLMNEEASFTASLNYFDLLPYQSLVRQKFDWDRAPHGWDAEISGRKKWGNNGMVKAFIHTESGGMRIWQKLPGSEDRGQLVNVQNSYTFGQASFKQSLKNDWGLYGGVSYSDNQDKFNLDQLQIQNENRSLHGKLVAVKGFSDKFSLKSGLEYFIFDYAENLLSQQLLRKFQDHQVNLFSEADYYFSNKLIFRGGLRFGSSNLMSQQWVDPRFSLAYKFNHGGQLSFAAGKYSQVPSEQFRIVAPEIQNTEASHLILNYFLSKNGRTLRVESFLKDYKKLLLYSGDLYQWENISQTGTGFANGIDIFYRDQKSIKNTDFWITYSLVNSKRSFGIYTEQVQPSFAPRNNGAIVVKHFISALHSQVGGSFSINDGYTYTDPNLGGQMNAKTPGFQDLSLSWSYLPRPNLIIHFACSNVLGRENIFGYQYSETPNSNGSFDRIPVGQPAPRFLFLGVFLTLSKDKQANQLNNL